MNKILALPQSFMERLQSLDFLAPLALRLYLAPVFWIAGMNKLQGFDNIVSWFGSGLGLPFPTLMAILATGTEVIGAVLLLVGLGVRWISIPLMATMAVAALSVHWKNGWQAVMDLKSPFPPETASMALQRLSEAKETLKAQGDYSHLTEYGSLVVSNNGVEWAVTYFIMLLALLFLGAGRFVSMDHYLQNWFKGK
ncbi:MAG: DoxX family protein [Thiotrichaceae bacterium]|nr:DoxX family protein [Thiotrichaceae bacterium]